MQVYYDDIMAAVLLFPLVAAVITVPFLIYQYRKYGKVPRLQGLLLYTFVLYCMCAYFLVIMPLPADRAAVVSYSTTPQLVPFKFVSDIRAAVGSSLAGPSTWVRALMNPVVYQVVFNLFLTMPLGMYLRYFFNRTWWQVLIIGFCTTLFFETSQLTGLWGYYEHAYRLFDVDDLIVNTAGAMLGFWMMCPIAHLMPRLDDLRARALEEGVRAGTPRRALSFAIDAALVSAAGMGLGLGLKSLADRLPAWALALASNEGLFLIDVCVFVLFFGVIPLLTGGSTLGQLALKLTMVRPDGGRVRFYQPLARYGLLALFMGIPLAVLLLIVMANDFAPGVGADASLGEFEMVALFVAGHTRAFAIVWLTVFAAWVVSLVVRSVWARKNATSLVMLNGLMSNTRVVTTESVRRARVARVRARDGR